MKRPLRTLFLLAALTSPVQAGDAITARPVNSEVSKLVGYTMRTEHYSGRDIDDRVSRDWLHAYLDRLDYSRLYFLKSDIEDFEAWDSTLDDDILDGQPKLQAAFAIHERFRQRLYERVDRAMELLDGEWDFTDPDARVDTDRHDDPWVATPAELDAVWKRRIGELLLQMELGDDPRDKAIDRMKKRYERLRSNTDDLTAADVTEEYLGALTRLFDPHSVWMKPFSKEEFDIDMTDVLTGIGAELGQEEGYTIIRRLIPGGPAEMSEELSPEDKILAVAQGAGGEPVEIIDMRIDKVVRLIRGKVDTEVVLTIHPGDATDPAERRQVTLLRKQVKLERAAAKGSTTVVDGVRIGVVEVPSFYKNRGTGSPSQWPSTSNDTAKIVAGFREQGVDAIVIDLRKNGGGRLDEARALTGLFLHDGPIVQIKSRKGRIEVLDDPTPKMQIWDGPLVVLTSELSASASEIFAAAIQDHKRGLIVGSRTTHGKGTVQDLQNFDDYFSRIHKTNLVGQGGAVKFTTHMFFRPSGGSTQVKGVAADVVLPSPWDGMEIGEGDLDNALPWDQIAAAPFRPETMKFDLEELRRRSSDRVGQSMEFAFMREDIMERERLDAKKYLSLHFDTRKADLDRSKAIKEARDTARRAAGWDGETDLDPILDEARQVARDMVKQLSAG